MLLPHAVPGVKDAPLPAAAALRGRRPTKSPRKNGDSLRGRRHLKADPIRGSHNRTGAVKSEIDWELSEPSKNGGYVVQHVTREIQVIDEAGTIVSESSLEYWEAWDVGPDSKVTAFHGQGGADDTFEFKGGPPGTHGTWTISGSARYYDGLNLPNTFQPQNVPQARISLSTNSDPHIPLSGASNEATHSLTSFW